LVTHVTQEHLGVIARHPAHFTGRVIVRGREFVLIRGSGGIGVTIMTGIVAAVVGAGARFQYFLRQPALVGWQTWVIDDRKPLQKGRTQGWLMQAR
jgi:hypothetical protein